jgi:hypothetical protein
MTNRVPYLPLAMRSKFFQQKIPIWVRMLKRLHIYRFGVRLSWLSSADQ